MKSNVQLIGMGVGTVIKVRDSHNAAINAIDASDTTQIVIANLKVDGNKANQTTGNMYGIYDSGTGTTYDSTIKNCYVTNFRNSGFYITKFQQSNIINNVCNNNNQFGMYLNLKRTNVTHNICYSNSQSGFFITPDVITIADNVAYSNSRRGFHIRVTYPLSFSGNTIFSNSYDGIFCDGGVGSDKGYATLTGNSLYYNSYHGINLEGSNHCIVIGNLLQSNSSGNSNVYNEINIEYDGKTAYRNSIIGNTIKTSSAKYCIFEESNVNTDYNLIIGNTVEGGVTGQILKQGANSVEHSNIPYTAPTPAAHKTTHQSTGSDEIKLDDLGTPDDNTNLNASITVHGLLPKLDNNASNFLNGQGNWASPGAGGGKIYATKVVKHGSDDGTADYYAADNSCQTAINSAITAVNSAGGGLVLLREGIYIVDGQITMLSNVQLVGMGMNNTIIKLKDGHNVSITIIYANQQENMLIKGITIDGNKANQTGGTNYGIHFYKCNYSRVTECDITNTRWSNGVWFQNWGYGSMIDHCRVRNSDAHGIDASTVERVTIAYNRVESNSNIGIWIGSEYGICIGNHVKSNSQSGIQIMGNYHLVTGNELASNASEQIYCDGNRSNIVGNICSSGSREGIALRGVYECTVKSNYLKTHSLATNNSYSSINLEELSGPTPSIKNSIIANTIIETGWGNQSKYAIDEEDSTCDRNFIESNYISKYFQTAPMRIQGEKTVVGVNHIEE